MESKGQRAQIAKLSGERCARGAPEHAFRITVGKQTKECAYRTPVFGRDLEIAATDAAARQDAEAVQRSAYLAVEPALRRVAPATSSPSTRCSARPSCARSIGDGSIEYLHIEKEVQAIGGVNKANQLRLRAFNVTEGEEKGNCRILAFVGGEMVADVIDAGAGELQRPRLRLLGRLGKARQGRPGERRRRRRARAEPLLALLQGPLRDAVDVFDRAAPLLRVRPARCTRARAGRARGRRRCGHRRQVAQRSLWGSTPLRRSG